MKITKALVVMLLFIVNLAIAIPNEDDKKPKTDAMLFGDVKDENTHIPFATVMIKGTTVGTAADATGHFKMTNLPVGNQIAVVSAMGYKPKEIELELVSNKSVTILVVLESDFIGIEQVVVSADRNQTNRSEAPVVVNSISPKLFEKTQSVNIAEGLCFTPGLRTECNCQNCGFTQLRMNGMEGPYSQVLMNSRPVFSGLAGVYGLELIPTNMVERIEVVRGGGSALFGGNAIAGTVNIITKEPTRNTFSLDGRMGIIGVGSHENLPTAQDYQLSVNTSVVTDDGNSGGYIYAMLRDKDAYDENGDGYTEAVVMENSTFGFNIFHKPGAKSKISLDGYRINEFRRGGNKLDYLPHETDVTEQLNHLITGANLSFDLFTDNYNKLTAYAAVQQVDRDSYYGAQHDPNAYGFTNDITSVAGAQYIVNSDKFLFAPSTTIFGIDNTNNKLDDNKLGANGEPNSVLNNQMVNTLGSFVQHDWKTDLVNVAVGLRLDNYMVKDLEHTDGEGDMSNTVLAPRISLLYKYRPNLRFRVGYAKGYRAPQIFNEDLHIELVNAKRVIHINSDDLIQETSHSLSASLNSNFYLKSTLNEILVEGFYTRLNDPFADQYYPLNDEGDWAYLRINSKDGAKVYGVNIEWNSFVTPKLETKLGFTLQKSEFDSPQSWGSSADAASTQFMRTPGSYGYATFDWHAFTNFSASFTLNYTGSMYVPHFGLDPDTQVPAEQEALANGDVIAGERLEYSEKFLIADILFDYKIKLTDEVSIKVYTGMKNIFNQLQKEHDSGMYRDASYIYGPCQPRTINFGLKIGNIF